MFSRDNNLVDKKFIEEVVALAGGLPLVLEVWSRYFIGHERKQWPSLLEKLKRIPHGDVQKQLQVSYDSLSVTAKNLFLDIACFFDGMDKELVVKVLHDEESTFFPDIEIQHLVDKFLVKDKGWNRFLFVAMNQVIREMGQEVIHQENVDEPGKRTRLTNHRDILRVFRDCSGTDSVRSIKLNSSHIVEPVTVQIEAFKKMSNLRFIQLIDRGGKLQWSFSYKHVIDKARFCFSFKHLKYLVRKRNKAPCKSMSACFSFKHLKYLEWDDFPCKSLDNIDMGNVVVIKLYKSKLEKLWEGVKIFKKLKILAVCKSSSLTKTGDFIGLENLENLSFNRCENLEELDSSIGCLQKLVDLNLGDCTRLKRLPWEMICKLTSLQKLNVSGCINLLEILDLPPSIKELKAGFTQVTRLRNLQKLDMQRCNIFQVSSGIGNLVSLSYLNLEYNTFSSLPESFNNLSKLKELVINRCSQLQLLPPLPSQLNSISANDCGSLDVMPFDSMQKAYTFHSKMFKESLMNTKGLLISLSGKKVPEWCTYRNRGNNDLSFEAPIRFDSKICGLILCSITDYWPFSTIHNKTKEKSHRMEIWYYEECALHVMFYPLNDKTVVVEAGDTVELQFDDATSCGLRLVYEDDVVDSGLVLPS